MTPGKEGLNRVINGLGIRTDYRCAGSWAGRFTMVPGNKEGLWTYWVVDRAGRCTVTPGIG